MEIDILKGEVLRTMVAYRGAIDHFITVRDLESSVRKPALDDLIYACQNHRSAHLHYREAFDALPEPRGQPLGRFPELEDIEGLYG